LGPPTGTHDVAGVTNTWAYSRINGCQLFGGVLKRCRPYIGCRRIVAQSDYNCRFPHACSRNSNAIANRRIVQEIACDNRPIQVISPIRAQDVKDSTKDQPSLSTTNENVTPAHDMAAVAPASFNHVSTLLGTQSFREHSHKSICRSAGKEQVVGRHNSVRKRGDEMVMSGDGYWNARDNARRSSPIAPCDARPAGGRQEIGARSQKLTCRIKGRSSVLIEEAGTGCQ
jgi:hypothetical protein